MTPSSLARRLAAQLIVLSTACTGLALAQQPAPAPAAAPAAKASVAASAPASADGADGAEGKVAYYGRKFAGRKTASGQRFNPEAMTMAHKSLPFDTQVRVTNINNKRSVLVRVNDRGPTAADRVGDLSLAAARKIGMLRSGVVMAKIEVLGQAPARKAIKSKKG